MKTFEYRDQSEKLVSFEIDSRWPRWLAYRLIRKLSGVRIIEPLRHFAFSNQDVFCVFELDGKRLQIEEPWGDSSRYLISAVFEPANNELEKVNKHFQETGPGFR